MHQTMTKQDTNAAAQHAEPAQVQEPINLSELTTIDTTEYEKDEDGVFMNRPNLNVCATLSHETEDYIRVIRAIRDIKPVLRRAEMFTHGEKDGALHYNNNVAPLLNKLLDVIARDMGVCITERLSLWGDNYL